MQVAENRNVELESRLVRSYAAGFGQPGMSANQRDR